MKEQYRIIISGGGTGGHIFPAISIANTFRKRFPDAEILFVGAEDRMEMEKVPAAGYEIVGLPVSGFDRAHLLNNIKVLNRLRKKPRTGEEDDPRVSSGHCSGSGRLCQRPDIVDGGFAGHSDPDTGAKLLCRSNQ